jgi:hypothetical protein
MASACYKKRRRRKKKKKQKKARERASSSRTLLGYSFHLRVLTLLVS